METTVFYVAVAYNGGFNPTVVEKFDNKTETQTAMRLLCAAQSNAGILYSSK